MSKNKKIILDGRIPIRLIPDSFCLKCMDIVNQVEDICHNCKNPPPIGKKWFFDEVFCLGIYSSYGSDDNDYSNKVPINILSELIYLLKFKKTNDFKNYAGKLIADGFFQLIDENPEIFRDVKYITTSPKYDRSEKNQCKFIIKPLLKKMKENGYDVENILNRTKRLKDVGKNKNKGRDERFNDIAGVHNVLGEDLNGKKVLIIEDVYTTGSTVWDLSRALKEKNAGEIKISAAGRYKSYTSWDVPSDLDFNELILYFSSLDIDRDYKKIDEVKVTSLEMLDDLIKASFKGSKDDYKLIINFDEKVIRHNCEDFIRNRMRNKKFCKHLTKIFIIINQKDKTYAIRLLNQIYLSLDKWEFKEFRLTP